jgi:hypothetical protein
LGHGFGGEIGCRDDTIDAIALHRPDDQMRSAGLTGGLEVRCHGFDEGLQLSAKKHLGAGCHAAQGRKVIQSGWSDHRPGASLPPKRD